MIRIIFSFIVIYAISGSPASFAVIPSGSCENLLDARPENVPGPLRNRTLKPSGERTALRDPGLMGVAPSPTKLDFLSTINSADDFAMLARTLRVNGQDQKVVKVVYHRDANGGPKLYFIDTDNYPYHFEFATRVLKVRQLGEVFNKNYGGTGAERSFNLASLVLDETSTPPRILMELWTGDTLAPTYFEELFDAVKAQFTWPINLAFHPLSVDQESMAAALKVPVVKTTELRPAQPYVALNEGEAFGYLEFVNPDDPAPELDMSHIAVFEQSPNDIGLMAGVITEQSQTALSHINVKSTNRHTPNMSLVNAKSIMRQYEGKPVRIVVGANGYEITLLNPATADRDIATFWAARKPKLKSQPVAIINPEYDRAFVDVAQYYRSQPTHDLHRTLIQTVGAKAANLGLLNTITARFNPSMGITSPPTLGVPFNFYDQFLAMSGQKSSTTLQATILDALDSKKLLDPTTVHKIKDARPILENVRAQMLQGEVPAPMIALFKHHIWDNPHSPLHYSKHPILLLRSSTNSEDLEGFTGAGLYNSTSLKLYNVVDGRLVLRPWKHIEADLRKKIPYIYASVWNERAYFERDWFGVDHRLIKAGIAVHGGFIGTLDEGPVQELANGVAITTNIYNQSQLEAIFINAQHYGVSVTNPPTLKELKELGEIDTSAYRTEELMVTTFLATAAQDSRPDSWKFWPYERLQSTSLRGSAPVLQSDDEVRRLAWGLKVVKQSLAYLNGKSPDNYAVDVEWNIFGSRRTISLNQARPFTTNTTSPQH